MKTLNTEFQLIYDIKQQIKKGKTKQDILKILLEDNNQITENQDYINDTLDMINSVYAILEIE